MCSKKRKKVHDKKETKLKLIGCNLKPQETRIKKDRKKARQKIQKREADLIQSETTAV